MTNLTRRNVLSLTAKAAAAGLVVRLPGAMYAAGPLAQKLTYGVQLYMVRWQAEKDLAGVLKSIAQIGYKQIELYAMAYNRPVTELRAIIQDSGLECISGHFDYADFAPKIDYAQKLGLHYMVCPMLPRPMWASLAGFREAAAQLNRWGATVHQAGMELLFHNHDYEFRPLEGSTGFKELMDHTDPSLVKLEMDIYWAVQAGLDPFVFLKTYAGRIKLVHLKDRTAGAPTGYLLDASAQHFTELGQGSIPWPALLEQASRQGVRYAYLDQDETSLPVLDSLRQSFQYLQTI
jgi:sugar phosphate isomerase/epimerase